MAGPTCEFQKFKVPHPRTSHALGPRLVIYRKLVNTYQGPTESGQAPKIKLLLALIARSTQRRGCLQISHSKAVVSFRYPHERTPTPCTDLLEPGHHGTLSWIWM